MNVDSTLKSSFEEIIKNLFENNVNRENEEKKKISISVGLAKNLWEHFNNIY